MPRFSLPAGLPEGPVTITSSNALWCGHLLVRRTGPMNFSQRFTFLFSAPTFDSEDLEGLRIQQIIAAIDRLGFQVVPPTRRRSSCMKLAASNRSATWPAVGYKFGHWTDAVMMQRSLGAGGSSQPQVWQAAPNRREGG
jgi:hypothetical protein